MESPYVLAKVHKSTSTSDSHIYTAPCRKSSSGRASSRELVAAIDSQGINIYDIRSNQLTTSYSLSPSTKFHCAPISVVDRASSSRSTYAALQTAPGQMKLQRWNEASMNVDADLTGASLKTRVRGLNYTKSCIWILYVNGDLECLSHDLKRRLQTISSSSYLDNDSDKIIDHRFAHEKDGTADHWSLFCILGGASMKLLKLKISPTDSGKQYELTKAFASLTQASERKAAVQEKTAIGEEAEVVILRSGPKHIEAVLFDQQGTETTSFKVLPSLRSEDLSLLSVKWLTRTQFVLCSAAKISLWDVAHETCVSSQEIEDTAKITTIVQQKRPESMLDQAACLVLCSSDKIHLTRLAYSKHSSLSNAIGSRSETNDIRVSELWLQDVDIQSTWKGSLSSLTYSAKECLNSLRKAQNGSEFDSIFETYLKTYLAAKSGSQAHNVPRQSRSEIRAMKRQQKLLALKAKASAAAASAHTNGTSDHSTSKFLTNGITAAETTKDNVQKQSVTTNGIAAQSPSAKKCFEFSGQDNTLSSPFVQQMLQLMSSELLTGSIPYASIDHLLRKRLLSLAGYAESSAVWRWVMSQQPELRIRFMEEAIGLLPEQLIDLLHSFLDDQAHLPLALTTAISRLDIYDEVLVTLAIKSKLETSDIETLMSVLQVELQGRLLPSEPSATLRIQDELLCACITNFLDALGVSNLMFSIKFTELLKELRESVSQLIASNRSINATATYLSELLMKARLVDTSKERTTIKDTGAVQSNPEPRPRQGNQSLDRIKKMEKGQTQRAKAYARVQGVGSVYTIETLQI